jgi:putative exporter of polyketide antibiotics
MPRERGRVATAADPTSTSLSTTVHSRERGHIGLVVLGSILSGLVLGLVLVLVVFEGAEEAKITGSALIALGAGFMFLAVVSSRFTDMPQRWAVAPAVALLIVGLALLVFVPGDRTLRLAGWVWPLLLVLLVLWSFVGARRSLHNWSRRALLYPALVVLLLIALGGGFETSRRQQRAIRPTAVVALSSSRVTVST